MTNKHTGSLPFSFSYGPSMSEYDDQLPVYAGAGTDLITELGRELTSPLFRQLPPGLITSTKNLRRTNLPLYPCDSDLLSASKELGFNGSTPSSNSSSVKNSRLANNESSSCNLSFSSSSGKRSMSRTLYKTELEHSFDFPQAEDAHLFQIDLTSSTGTVLTQSTNKRNDQRENLASDLKSSAALTQAASGEGISLDEDGENPSAEHADHTDHTDHVDHTDQSTTTSNNMGTSKRSYSIIPQETRERLIHLVCIDGMNVQSAVKKLNLKYSAAINIVRKFRDCGQLEIGPRGRRSKKTVSPEMSSAIAAILTEHPKIEVAELRQMLKTKGITFPPSLIKDTAMNIRRQQMDMDAYQTGEETYDAQT